MAHFEDRLNERGLEHISADFIREICAQFQSAAILIEKLPYIVRCEDGSNGDMVIAIARNGYPTTIMLRRSGQPMSNLRVDEYIGF